MNSQRMLACAACLSIAWAVGGGAHAEAEAADSSLEALQGLSIEDLANVQVSTVSRRQESLAQAAAATYVITRDEIIRRGARTLPEILRLAPNLFVAQTSASSWVITARGQSGNLADQAFSNKLLVLIDGRSVYTPLFSGVYWDLQDVLISDIDHIEVISGPAGTLWGANAVNGVINIITRKTSETTGLAVAAGGGDQEQIAAVRAGGLLGEKASWRLYARAYHADDTLTSTGVEAQDRWGRLQGGFRVDWQPTSKDEVSLHGDAFKGSGKSIGHTGGGNVYGRWAHELDNGDEMQAQAYVSREQRGHDSTGGVPLWVNTYDIDTQYAKAAGRHELVIGAGVRHTDYRIAFSPGLQFDPTKGGLDLASLFAQDTLSLSPAVRLIVGLKLERDPYAGWSGLPNARLAWTPNKATLVWAAISRAVRSPTPFDRDVREKVGSLLFLTGSRDFDTEKLTAYEVGARLRPSDRLSFSVSAYFNDYDDLRSIETNSATVFLPIRWGQMIEGHSQGVEAWADFQASERWRVSAGVNLLDEKFHFRPGASGLLGISQVGDDPKVQAMLKSSLQVTRSVTWDAVLRHQGELPDPKVPAYTELNSRLAWDINQTVQVAVIGYNLLHDQHLEFMAPQSNLVPRSVFAELRWRF